MARMEVLGFLESICRSAMRLKAIAAVRQLTMAITIHKNLSQPGQPRAAHIIPIIAKGRAKIECSIFTISRKVRRDFTRYRKRPLFFGRKATAFGKGRTLKSSTRSNGLPSA